MNILTSFSCPKSISEEIALAEPYFLVSNEAELILVLKLSGLFILFGEKIRFHIKVKNRMLRIESEYVIKIMKFSNR